MSSPCSATSFDEGFISFESNKSFDNKTNLQDGLPTSKQTQNQLKSLYSIKDQIYDNGTARLYKATCRKTHQPVVIKRMLKSKSVPDEIILAMKANNACPNYTLPVLFTAEDQKYYTYVQPFFGKSLYDFMAERNDCLSMDEARYVYKQVLVCLIILQEQAGIYHLDIKEENILIDPNTYSIKLIDFGVSRTSPVPKDRIVGSKEFYSPEIYLGQSSTDSIPKHDVWSLAVSIFSSLSGRTPYENLGDVLNGEERINMNNVSHLLDDKLCKVFRNMFVLNYRKRVSLRKLLDFEFFH